MNETQLASHFAKYESAVPRPELPERGDRFFTDTRGQAAPAAYLLRPICWRKPTKSYMRFSSTI